MPLRKELRRAKGPYGYIWRTQVRPRILKRVGGAKCEKCGAPDRAVGYRNQSGRFIELGVKGGAAARLQGYKVIRIVIAVCHRNHDYSDNHDQNLWALCQKNHLKLDKAHHRLSRQVRKDRARPLLLGDLEVTNFEPVV